MITYIVTFQTSTEETRQLIIKHLKEYGWYCPIHNYCWAIRTDKKASEIRDGIKSLLNAGDRTFVVRSGTEAAWFNIYGDENSKWLKKNL